jgi:nucleoside phosphorylase
VVLTALPIEYSAVRSHLSEFREIVHKGTIYEQGEFLAEKVSWEVGIAQIGAGNAGAAASTERALDYFQPDFIFLVGVAGGVKDVAIGDVVVATKVYGYESGKVGESGLLARPEIGQSSHRLVQRAQAEALKEHWKQRILHSLPGSSPSPRAFVGPIAAGEKVLASRKSTLMAFLHTTYNDTLAVEMEGIGFLQAVWRNEGVQAVVVRGISDLLTKKQQSDAQGSQNLASWHASAFAFTMLASLNGSQVNEPPPEESARPPVEVRNVQAIGRGNVAIGGNVLNSKIGSDNPANPL